jgi:hypothetical protein
VRAKLIWLAILIPTAYFLLVFLGEGIPVLGKGGLNIARTELYATRSIQIVINLAIGLGVINLFAHHLNNIARHRKDWIYSVVVFVSFFAVTGALIHQYRIDAKRRAIETAGHTAAQRLDATLAQHPGMSRDQGLAQLAPADREALQQAEQLAQASRYDYRFEPGLLYANYIRRPLEATVMALLGFYITYAAYRAFRIRSLEATVMMLSAAIVILGSDSFGGWLTGGRLTAWADFDNRVLNSGMQRGLAIGIGVAIIAGSLRMMLGLEKGILGTRQGEQ